MVSKLQRYTNTGTWQTIFDHDAYVNVSGSQMTGPLTVLNNVITTYGIDQQIKLSRSTSSTYAYIGFYWGASAVDASGGTRNGWVGLHSGGDIFHVGDAGHGAQVWGDGGATRVVCGADDTVRFYTATTQRGYFDASGRLIISGGATTDRLRLYGYSGGESPYLSFYSSAGTRYGYVQGTATNLNIISDAGDISLNSGGGQVRCSDGIYAVGQSRFWNTGGNPFVVSGTGGSAYIQFYGAAASNDSIGTRYGYIGHVASVTMRIVSDSGTIDFYPNGVYQGRWTTAGDFLASKTAVDTTTVGCAVTGGGRVYTTTGNTTHYNFISNIIAATENQYHLHMRRSDATVGSINMNAALTGVDYATTCDLTWKDEIEDICDDEALARVETWRPRKFRWRYDDKGHPTPKGRAAGPVVHSFVAQEMAEITAHCVTPGRGTWDDHLDWCRRKDEGDEGCDPAVSPYEPWMMDFSKLVPDLAAAVRALIHRVQALEK